MTESIKAVRVTVLIGSIAIDGFMLPDGAYRMSQAQAIASRSTPTRKAAPAAILLVAITIACGF